MKKLALMSMAALATMSLSAPAFAQQLTPVAPGIASGNATLNGNLCTLTIPLNPTTSSSGTTGAGTNTGAGICPLITIDSGAGYSITPGTYNPTGGAAGLGSASGTMTGLVVRVNGTQACPTGSVNVNVENTTTPGTVLIQVPLQSVGSCTVSANLRAATYTLVP